MEIDLATLPGDTLVLHQIINDLVLENGHLKDQLALLKAKRFGKSSEKLDQQINQLEFFIEEAESTGKISFDL